MYISFILLVFYSKKLEENLESLKNLFFVTNKLKMQSNRHCFIFLIIIIIIYDFDIYNYMIYNYFII